MVDFSETPLELQLREVHCHIQGHVGKGCKYLQFLSPMFLRRFPVIMDNQISVDCDTVTGAYDRAPLFPITLIDTEVLDYWCTHPTVREVACNLQHSQWVLAIVCDTLPEGNKGKPAVIFGASLVYILALSGTNQPERCPVLLEVCQERLHHLSIDAHEADIFFSTPKEPVLYFITHQRQLRHGPWSTKFIRSGYSPCGQS